MSNFVGTAVVFKQTTDSVTFTAYTNDPQLTENVAAVDTSVLGTQAKTYIPGRSDAKLSFKVFYDDGTWSTSPQGRLNSWKGVVKAWEVQPKGAGTGNPDVTFSGFITSWKEMFANNDQAIGADVELQVTGAITRTTL